MKKIVEEFLKANSINDKTMIKTTKEFFKSNSMHEKSVAKNKLERFEYQLHIIHLSNKFISKDVSLEISKNR